MADYGSLQADAKAVRALLEADLDLVLFELTTGGPNTIPAGTVPPYVSFHVAAARTLGVSLDMRSTRTVSRIYTHSVGLNDTAARAVSDRVAHCLLDRRPTILGRVVFPIRQEPGRDPREDDSTGLTHVTISETWRLETLPG